MGRINQLEIPLGGLNTVNPFVPLESGFARELTNYGIINGRLQKRPPSLSRYEDANFNQMVWYDIFWDRVITNTGTIRTLSGASTGGSIGGTPVYGLAHVVKHVSLTLLIGVREPRDAVGLTFTAWTFTTIGITASAITSACSHKGRLYVCDGSVIEYSNVGQITGAMYDSFDVSEFMDGQTVSRIFTCTIGSGNTNADNVFVIFGDAGKVLVYQGDYPASSTWNLIGNYDMPALASVQAFVEIDGDIFVATKKYAYWFRELFIGGTQTAYENSPTRPIENLWASCLWQYSATNNTVLNSHIFYYEPYDAIICQCSSSSLVKTGTAQIADYETDAVYFVYHKKYRAWALWLMAPLYSPIVGQSSYSTRDQTYIYGQGLTDQIRSIGTASFPRQVNYDTITLSPDVKVKIETSWKTPYFANPKGLLQKITGLRPFFSDTVEGFFDKIRIIFDYSDQNTLYGFYSQSNAPIVRVPSNYADAQILVPTVESDQYSPYVSISGIGGQGSVQFTQGGDSTATSNDINTQEIYGAAVYVEDGGVMI
jgi:hypothetical protein